MKTTTFKAMTAAIVMIAMFHVPDASAGNDVGWFKRNFGSLTYEQAITVVESPEDICDRVSFQVNYKDDKYDEWSTGRATWKRGYGDCEDFAFCVKSICDEKGIESRVEIMSLKGSWQSHAVAIGTWEGSYWISSNGDYHSAKSEADARKKAAGLMGWKPDRVVFEVARPPKDMELRSIRESMNLQSVKLPLDPSGLSHLLKVICCRCLITLPITKAFADLDGKAYSFHHSHAAIFWTSRKAH